MNTINEERLNLTTYGYTPVAVNGQLQLHGNDQDNIIDGTSDSDDILGFDGEDEINGLAGDDTINGGADNDQLSGGDGSDTLYGDIGNDILYGGIGNDTLYGGLGNDNLSGEDGDDYLYPSSGDDSIYGGSGNDTIYINPPASANFIDGDNYIEGGEGYDAVVFNYFNASDALIEDSNGYTYVSIGDSIHTMTSVEELRFEDTTIYLGTPETDQEVNSSYSPNDDLFVVQHDGIISKGIGNDTYIFAPVTVASNADISISDTQGNNTLQFTAGFSVNSSMIASDGLLLNMENGTTITILSASDFEFELGGNPLSGIAGETYSFSEFVETVIGATVPTSGATNANGFTVDTDVTGNDNTDTIEIIVGESTTYAGTEAQDIFALDVIAATQSTADTQVTITSFDTATDRLEITLEGTTAGEYTLQDLADTTSITAQQNPFNNSIIVNLGADADGDAIAITLNGISDTDSIYVDVV